MTWPHFNSAPAPLWRLWRDLTWCREKRRKFIDKMQRYYDGNENTKAMAVDRVKRLAGLKDGGVWDWDDNVPKEWADILVRRWGLK